MSVATPPAPPPALPPEDGNAPLQELSRDHLSVFLFVAFTPDELLALVRGLGITVRGGFRPETLGDVERADLVADELRAAKGPRKKVIEKLREVLGDPALLDVPISRTVARELADAAIEEAAMPRFLWRVLADPDPETRAQARPALDRLLAAYYPKEGEPVAPSPGGLPREPAEGGRAEAPPSPGVEALRAVQAELRAVSKRAARGERERDKALAQLARFREQVRAARAEAAAATREAAAARKALARAESRETRLAASLVQARGKGAAAEVTRLRKEQREARHEVEALTAQVAALQAERGARASERTTGEPRAPGEPGRGPEERSAGEPRAAPAAGAEAELEDAPATWLMPVFTREFYDSLQGWDRRIQRAAFKQAQLLAQDHRHPSLRALPLEGLQNLYRVRVATDVRLLYRRGEGNVVELLSLIDREDLDRYIKQAKERG